MQAQAITNIRDPMILKLLVKKMKKYLTIDQQTHMVAELQKCQDQIGDSCAEQSFLREFSKKFDNILDSWQKESMMEEIEKLENDTLEIGIVYPQCQIYGQKDFIQIDIKWEKLCIQINRTCLEQQKWVNWLEFCDDETASFGVTGAGDGASLYRKGTTEFLMENIPSEYRPLMAMFECDQRNNELKVAFRPDFSHTSTIVLDKASEDFWYSIIHAKFYTEFYDILFHVGKPIKIKSSQKVPHEEPIEVRDLLLELIDDYKDSLTSKQYKNTVEQIARIPKTDQSLEVMVYYPHSQPKGDEWAI